MIGRHIGTEIEVNASATRIWALLIDFDGMPSWNPLIRSISGTLAQRAPLSVHIAPPGKSGMQFKPKFLLVRPERELRWLGHLFAPGILMASTTSYLNLLVSGEHVSRTVKNSPGFW